MKYSLEMSDEVALIMKMKKFLVYSTWSFMTFIEKLIFKPPHFFDIKFSPTALDLFICKSVIVVKEPLIILLNPSSTM